MKKIYGDTAIKRILCCSESALKETCIWSRPTGGLFLWLRWAEDVDLIKLKVLTAERGFYYVEGKDFYVEDKTAHIVRSAFGHVPDASITQAFPMLAECIARCRQSHASGQLASLFDDRLRSTAPENASMLARLSLVGAV